MSYSENTRHQKIVTIELPNNGRGFGFSVVSDGNRGTIVHSIIPGSIADKVCIMSAICIIITVVYIFIGSPFESGRLAASD